MRYLLDTNIVSDLIRNPHGRAASRAIATGDEALCTSIVVAAELRFGALKRGAKALSARVAAVLSTLQVEPFEPPADAHYAHIRMVLEASGQQIGANDMLIAAHAIALDCTLVTDNEREFVRVPGLRVANWLR